MKLRTEQEMYDHFHDYAEKYRREFGGDRKCANWVKNVALFALTDLHTELTGCQMPDETGWLIEFSQRVSVQPTWYGKTDDGLGQTTDSLKAVRFSRKEDAEAVIEDMGWTEATASEHMWCDPPSNTPPQT